MTPYRVIVFGTCRAWQVWHNADPDQPFLFPAIRAIVKAREYLQFSDIRQVQIRTNQDRKILIYNKHADGTITHYRADGEA